MTKAKRIASYEAMRGTFAEDVARGRWDVGFWAWRFLGVLLHPGQLRLGDAYIRRNQTGWRAAFNTICLAAGNRAGKTMALAIVVFHSCFYKMGSEPPLDETDAEAKRWRTRPYMWFHFAISQEVADLLFDEIIHLLSGVHPAQHDGCPLVDDIEAAGGTKIATTDIKYKGDYRWVVLDPLLGGAEIHFRTTGEKALGSLGRDMHGVSVDECGLEPRLLWIVDNVLHLRRLGTGGQLFLVSTPEEGLTEFADFWFLGDPEAPDRRPHRFSMRMSTRENIGYGISQDVFDEMTADMSPDHIKQNIDGFFVQGRFAYFNVNSVDGAFIEDMPEEQSVRKGHRYVQGVDPALKIDSMWSIVLDMTREPARGVRAEQKRGKKTTAGIVEFAQNVHNSYDQPNKNADCITAVDAVGFGGKMFKEMLDEGIPGASRAVESGGTTMKKRKLLGDLRSMLDSGKLKMPRSGAWLKVRRQLLGYKLEDGSIEQDAVMALAYAISEVRRNPVDGFDAIDFNAYAVDGPIMAPRMDFRRRRRQDG